MSQLRNDANTKNIEALFNMPFQTLLNKVATPSTPWEVAINTMLFHTDGQEILDYRCGIAINPRLEAQEDSTIEELEAIEVYQSKYRFTPLELAENNGQ